MPKQDLLKATDPGLLVNQMLTQAGPHPLILLLFQQLRKGVEINVDKFEVDEDSFRLEINKKKFELRTVVINVDED